MTILKKNLNKIKLLMNTPNILTLINNILVTCLNTVQCQSEITKIILQNQNYKDNSIRARSEINITVYLLNFHGIIFKILQISTYIC